MRDAFFILKLVKIIKRDFPIIPNCIRLLCHCKCVWLHYSHTHYKSGNNRSYSFEKVFLISISSLPVFGKKHYHCTNDNGNSYDVEHSNR